jgi:hypothetical protein
MQINLKKILKKKNLKKLLKIHLYLHNGVIILKNLKQLLEELLRNPPIIKIKILGFQK